MELGEQVLNKNSLKTIIIENEGGVILASNVYNHILCFVCDKGVKLGIYIAQLEALSNSLLKQLEPLKKTLLEEDVEEDE